MKQTCQNVTVSLSENCWNCNPELRTEQTIEPTIEQSMPVAFLETMLERLLRVVL